MILVAWFCCSVSDFDVPFLSIRLSFVSSISEVSWYVELVIASALRWLQVFSYLAVKSYKCGHFIRNNICNIVEQHGKR